MTDNGKIVGNISASDLNDIYKLPKGLAEVLHSPISDVRHIFDHFSY